MSGGVFGVLVMMWLLVTLDGAFAGFRDAAGRSPMLRKRRMFRRNIVRGVGWAQVAWCLSSLVLGTIAVSGVDPVGLGASIEAVGGAMLWVYGPYAALVLGALALYAVPHPDVSSLATVLVLGPFTLIRPLVVLGGLAAGIWQADGGTAVAAVVGCGLVLAVEPVLGRRWRGIDPVDAHLY